MVVTLTLGYAETRVWVDRPLLTALSWGRPPKAAVKGNTNVAVKTDAKAIAKGRTKAAAKGYTKKEVIGSNAKAVAKAAKTDVQTADTKLAGNERVPAPVVAAVAPPGLQVPQAPAVALREKAALKDQTLCAGPGTLVGADGKPLPPPPPPPEAPPPLLAPVAFLEPPLPAEAPVVKTFTFVNHHPAGRVVDMDGLSVAYRDAAWFTRRHLLGADGKPRNLPAVWAGAGGGGAAAASPDEEEEGELTVVEAGDPGYVAPVLGGGGPPPPLVDLDASVSASDGEGEGAPHAAGAAALPLESDAEGDDSDGAAHVLLLSDDCHDVADVSSSSDGEVMCVLPPSCGGKSGAVAELSSDEEEGVPPMLWGANSEALSADGEVTVVPPPSCRGKGMAVAVLLSDEEEGVKQMRWGENAASSVSYVADTPAAAGVTGAGASAAAAHGSVTAVAPATTNIVALSDSDCEVVSS